MFLRGLELGDSSTSPTSKGHILRFRATCTVKSYQTSLHVSRQGSSERTSHHPHQYILSHQHEPSCRWTPAASQHTPFRHGSFLYPLCRKLCYKYSIPHAIAGQHVRCFRKSFRKGTSIAAHYTCYYYMLLPIRRNLHLSPFFVSEYL